MSIYETSIKSPKKIIEFYKELCEQKDVEIRQLKEQINNLECLVESIKLGVTLNQEQEELLDKILFRSDK